MMFKSYLIVSVFFVVSYGASIIQNNDIAGPKNEISSDLETSHADCPVHSKPADCAEIYENGFYNNGVYTIYPRNKVVTCGGIKVYCDMKTDRGGWTVIQRRENSNREADYFFKTWNEYKTGFGSVRDDFWLGNDNIYALTNQKKYSVRFDLKFNSDEAYAVYDNFSIENEELKYRLRINGYKGTAGDAMAHSNNSPFSTKDRNNENKDKKDRVTTNCAQARKGAWWYYDCTRANLNGLYLNGKFSGDKLNGTYWRDWQGYKVSLTNVEIKIRPYGFEL